MDTFDCLNCGDCFMGVYICQNIKLYPLYMYTLSCVNYTSMKLLGGKSSN